MTFYFTAHRSDLIRARLLPGARLMLVASGMWQPDRGRLAVARPPAGHCASLCLDSGGFTAAKRWGEYPWTPAAYAAWARRTAERDTLDFVAVMDYACERGVNRDVYATNRPRIQATVDNACRCLDAAPALPWLPVVQGFTADDYLHCADLYARRGFRLTYAGLGTVCGRPWRAAARLLNTLRGELPAVRWHVFGMNLSTLRDDGAASVVRSWDSYAWNWGTGAKGDGCRLSRGKEETWSGYCRRLAEDYDRRVRRMLGRPRGLPLF